MEGSEPVPVWQDILWKMEEQKWPLVILTCGIFIRMKLWLMAAALPLLVYWRSTVSAREEGQDDADRGAGEGAEDDDAQYEQIDGHRGGDFVHDESFWKGGFDNERSRGGDAFDDDGDMDSMFKGLSKFDDLTGFKVPDYDFGTSKSASNGGLSDSLTGLDDAGLFGDLDLFGGGGSRDAGKGKGKAKGKSDGGKGKESDPKQVLVSNLGDLPEEEVKAFFEDVGEIVRTKMLTHPDGQSKGLCFITFQSEQSAREALGMDGTELIGRRISVKPPGGQGGKGKDSSSASSLPRDFSGAPKGDRGPDPKQVFVAGVGDMDELALQDYFGDVGEVTRLKLLTHPDGSSKGVCFVTFRTEEQAQEALRLNGSSLEGKRLNVRLAGSSKGGDKGAGKADAPSFGDLAGDRLHSKGGNGFSGAGKSEKAGKGADRGPRVEQLEPRTEMDELLEEALEEEDGHLMLSDFHSAAKRFLTALSDRDKAEGTDDSVRALDMVFEQCRRKERGSVSNWPAYVYALLKKYDPQLTDEIQDVMAGRARPGARAKDESPMNNDVQRAWKTVPDAPQGGKQVLDRWGKPVLLY